MRALAAADMAGDGVGTPDWYRGVMDALQWSIKEGGGPAMAEMERRLPIRVDVMQRPLLEQFLGYSLPDDEWESIRQRGIDSGKWVDPQVPS